MNRTYSEQRREVYCHENGIGSDSRLGLEDGELETFAGQMQETASPSRQQASAVSVADWGELDPRDLH